MPVYRFLTRRAALVPVVSLTLFGLACGDDTVTPPLDSPDHITFTSATIDALDSTTQVIVDANPGNSTLKSLADSTLLVLTAGIQAKRVDVTTNLTTAPLYFVGIHRTTDRASNAFSTWTLVGMDDPSHLENIIEVAGFASVATGDAPTSISGTVGGVGSINGRLMQVAAGGAVAEWPADAGSASFTSDPPGAACPNFTPPPNISCTLETMHVRFTISGTSSAGGGGTRSAAQTVEVDVPGMRLTYTP
jgi:hypothetical protein